ncbi:urease accessory protein UreH domain-containing protein [Anaerorhabdus sp.]|uniref:urease accessory protein UreH domain-containing protein n=1 Tax=Anaerorhabdus sp. TaxID=1872524 RepID=UPI002FCA18A3
MGKKLVTKKITILGMTCGHCALKIEEALKKTEGVKSVNVSYQQGNVRITYDESLLSFEKIKKEIKKLDYLVAETKQEKTKGPQLLVIFIVLLGGYVLLNHFEIFEFFNFFPEAKEGMSLITLFVVGLLTSVHCVGMCGGINLSQCLVTENSSSNEKLKSNLLYNVGRVISYTVLGGLVGLLGSVVSINGVARGAVALFAGVFMIIMGLNMLNVFPALKRLSVFMPKSWNTTLKKKNNSPFYIGLLNGLMPCGPLQSMQLFALSTGSLVQGALSMFVFSLGTLPLMFGFGFLGTMLSKKSTATMMKISAALVVLLGLGMINTGISMSGFLAFGTEVNGNQSSLIDNVQIVEIEVGSRSYSPITVKENIPVKFNLLVKEGVLNGCNNEVVIPEYGIRIKLQEGDNWVEFTPTEAGIFPYSCWMNMIRSSITVTK